MVAGSRQRAALLRRVGRVYEWLGARLRESGASAGSCRACGECCDFDTFGHRLFVTEPELLYLAQGLAPERLRPMPTGRCPYNIDGKCSVYQFRFAACRIFACGAEKDLTADLSEQTLGKLKTLCTEFEIPYRYTDVATALNGAGG